MVRVLVAYDLVISVFRVLGVYQSAGLVECLVECQSVEARVLVEIQLVIDHTGCVLVPWGCGHKDCVRVLAVLVLVLWGCGRKGYVLVLTGESSVAQFAVSVGLVLWDCGRMDCVLWGFVLVRLDCGHTGYVLVLVVLVQLDCDHRCYVLVPWGHVLVQLGCDHKGYVLVQ